MLRPNLVLFCVQPQAGATELQQGGSIFPAVQNFLLAARAQGLGAAITLWHGPCDPNYVTLVGIPDDWQIATLVTVGWPKGGHRPVRRKPLAEVAVVDRWDQPWRSETRMTRAHPSFRCILTTYTDGPHHDWRATLRVGPRDGRGGSGPGRGVRPRRVR